MRAVFNLIRGRNEAQASQGLTPLEEPPAQQSGKELDNPASSESDTLSIEARNEKEVQSNPNQVTSYADVGVKKAEAAALVWTRKALYATYAW